jgi:ligand-binding SRPBCC domain-containing protein
MERLELSTVVQAHPDEVWEFFRQHDNILILAPPENEIRIIHPPMPVYLDKDLEVEYKIKNPVGGFTHWKARITGFDPPNYLADEQVEGPFENWKQEYFFRHLPYEGTEITNVIHYTPLWGALGKILDVVFVQNMLINMMEYRAEQLLKIFNPTEAEIS